MDHTLPLISTLALAFGLALVFGYFAERLRFPALVGYLFAGVLCSAHTPGPVADMELASQLSELGVILLMFGVGLHFSIQDLLKVRHIAIPGAVLQMTIATVLGLFFAWLMLYAGRTWVFTLLDDYASLIPAGAQAYVSGEMLFAPAVFLCALLVCVVLNLLSALVPAWLSLRKPIVYSLYERR